MSDDIWITKEGQGIPYGKLADSHLLNILRYIRKQAVTGMEIVTGGFDEDDIPDGDSETLYGIDVLDRQDYEGLKEEALKRGFAEQVEKIEISLLLPEDEQDS